jgi:hypothetical protein
MRFLGVIFKLLSAGVNDMELVCTSETRRKYIRVGSAPASLLATVTEVQTNSIPFPISAILSRGAIRCLR